ncbi:RsmB/NOP family class I SAM-dependent RNA methyltransferase [Mesorhizobium sp. M7A.F.Ca.CA.001.07.2.1]|uniref:RsmB/NOP family class I SAM-dependent RNA methyltransferase n=5 Tax=Phyllobacteriaceae TaxID=69277 RepID=UPI000FCAC8A3|nr:MULTISPECIES: RsmB/NOP family class I SAM-dependent RNA methyltransferase [Mesorhizobium]MCF6126614.1 RsmB/NOP family class I SAM-dependent RNA methyltransferase [Mesorhizobium ciceri]MCQ8817702.1 RsmB/NOP family class I SAM-dependent RNA methyltransferase [Mesorhizobium sp. SEMIA396]RUV35045.1 RsmB/NOP family class I SAM-dependent RNA methyltransferase [Mesorhizobium sp. M7A.F.Ca.MR.148.00.0.0]RUX88383.1 RsmB/NOP family class I SAM-dependent RNA methyltransferase [Mesorhizobium sp. M7A.F.Ca
MRLGGRLAAAIEVLEDIGRRHRPVADALKDWGLSHRFAGGGDRAAIGNIVYDALRHKRSAGWLLGQDTPRAIGFGALLLEWRQTAQSLNEALDGDKFAPPLLTAAELQAIAERRLDDAPAAVRADVPDWCAPLFERAFGSTWADEGAALATRPPLDLRVNTLQANRDKVLAELTGTGAKPSAIAPHGIRIPPIDGDGRHPNVQAEPAFQKGWFEVQDEGSQIAAALAGAEAGMQVLDFCAGAGGKTLALSASMENRGQIFAHDAEKARLAPIFDRIRRSENRNVQIVTKPAELAPLGNHMDIVLVDAPCTGSGTWRRRPDAKWRLTQRQLDARKGEQSAILDAAKVYVKPGGLLVYITCSVFDEENGEQIAAFRDRNSGFVPVDHRQLWDSRFPGHEAAARIGARGDISLSPALSGTDGFYLCALRRSA